jgi:alginate production protein
MQHPSNKIKITSAVLAVSIFTIFISTAHAQDSKIKIQPSLSTQFKTLENNDLQKNNQLDTYSLTPRIRIIANLSEDTQAVLDARAVIIDGSTTGEDDTGEAVSNNNYAELKQYYLKFDGHQINADNYNLQIGRQRIREDLALWWNRDIEAVRINYDTTLLKGFVAVAQPLSSNKTSDDFYEASQDRLRFLGQASFNYQPEQFLDLRALYENDYSGTGHIGDVIQSVNADNEDFKLGWYGARAHGSFEKATPSIQTIKYRLDGIIVKGSEDLVTSTTASSTTRNITKIDNNDVFGWAIDANTNITLNTAFTPTLTLGYAFGSNDFRQSDLHGNGSLTSMGIGSIYNYGEVLRPELSNIHILTTGVALPVGQFSDLNMFYHYYHLVDASTSLRSSGVNASLNNTDKNLGHEIDVVFNSNITQVLNLNVTPLEQIKFKGSAGIFRSGSAYGQTENENTARIFTELLFSF